MKYCGRLNAKRACKESNYLDEREDLCAVIHLQFKHIYWNQKFSQSRSLPENPSTLIVQPIFSCQVYWCTFESGNASLSLSVVNLKTIPKTCWKLIFLLLTFVCCKRSERALTWKHSPSHHSSSRLPSCRMRPWESLSCNSLWFNFHVYMLHNNHCVHTWGQGENLRSSAWKVNKIS